MAQSDEHQDGGQNTTTTAPTTAKQLLDQVTVELATFDAKKLPELKTELTAFVNQQEALVNDYKAKYEALRKQWCDRQRDFERLCNHVRCEFPLTEEKWRKAILDCICKKQYEVCCLEQRIAKRKRCCSGPRQQARDEAQAAADLAKKKLDWLTTLVKSLDAILTANLTLVGQIEKTPATERPVVLYLFLKLRQAHLRMAPDDAPASSKTVCPDWDVDKLCETVFNQACKDEDNGCAPKDYKPAEGCKPAGTRGAWLLDPESYAAELDKAWLAYRTARETLAQKDAALKEKPDDLDSLSKALAAAAGGLEEAIKKCLKDLKPPKDDCNKQTTTGKTGAENA